MMTDLLCNLRACRVALRDKLWVTSCHHSFCEEHSEAIKTTKECPACKTSLRKPFDIIRQNSKPCEGLKSMLLVGLHPKTVFLMTQHAIEFWNNQMKHEVEFQRYSSRYVRETEKKCKSQEQKSVLMLQEELLFMKEKCSSLENKMASYQQQIQELRDKVARKNKQQQEMHVARNRSEKKTTQSFYYNDPNIPLFEKPDDIATEFAASNNIAITSEAGTDFPSKMNKY